MSINRITIIALLLLLVFTTTMYAQDPAATQPAPVSSVTGSVTSDGAVRMIAHGESLQIRMEIYSATGELVSDSGLRNGNIIDFTDFMPTFAKIAGIPATELATYGIMDGRSFYRQLSDPNSQGRPWSYGYYFPYPNHPDNKRVYVQDTIYKLYDVTNNNYFFNLQLDSLEKFPIPNDQLTPDEVSIKERFSKVLARMHN